MPLVDLNLPSQATAIDRSNSNFSPPPSNSGQDQNNSEFANRFASLFHFEPRRIATVGYKTIYMLCEAIKKAGDASDKDGIISAINEMQPGEQ
jgi:hypothetical protein